MLERPKRPIRPSWLWGGYAQKPTKLYNSYTNIGHELEGAYTLDSFIEKLKSLYMENSEIVVTYNTDDGFNIEKCEIIENVNYEEQMIKYEKDKKKYDDKMVKYEEKMKEYNKALAKYKEQVKVNESFMEK